MPPKQPHVLGGEPIAPRRFLNEILGTVVAIGTIYATAWLLDWAFAENAAEVFFGAMALFVTHGIAYGAGAKSSMADTREQTSAAFLTAFNAWHDEDHGKAPSVNESIERVRQRQNAKVAAILLEGAAPLLERFNRETSR